MKIWNGQSDPEEFDDCKDCAKYPIECDVIHKLEQVSRRTDLEDSDYFITHIKHCPLKRREK